MDKKIDVKCECEGTGFTAVADDGGEGVEHVECGQHHPAFKDAPSVDKLRHRQFRHLVPKRASSRSISLTSLRAVLVRELAGPRDAIEFGSCGPKPGETELAFDLVHSPRQRSFLPGLRTPVDTLAIEFHDPRASICIQIGIAAASSHVVLRLLDRLNCGFRRSDARPILLLLLRWLRRQLQALEKMRQAEALRSQR